MTVFELLYFCPLRFEFQHKIQNSTDVMVSGVLQQKLLCCVLKFILTLDYVILIFHLIVVCRRFFSNCVAPLSAIPCLDFSNHSKLTKSIIK